MKRCRNGKVKYRTEKEANKGRMYILSHDPSANMFDLMPYVCPLCGYFHVGHRSKYLLSTARAVLPKDSATSDGTLNSGPSTT
jgi:hypothetical protein